MAESVFSDVVSSILKKVGSSAYKKLKFAKDLDSHLEKLRDLKTTVEATLRDAAPVDSCSNAQQDVFDKLNGALAELDDFLDAAQLRAELKEVKHGHKFIKDVRLFFSKSNQLVLSLKQADELKAILEKFDCIANNHARFGSIMVPCANRKRSSCSILMTSSYVLNNFLVGRDKDRENIVSLISDDSTASVPLSVTSIVGVGGLGKTTLAWYVYRDERLKGLFDVQFWVSGGQNFDFSKVLESIISFGKEEKPLDCNTEVQLYDRYLQFIQGKKFLLVLDNMWDQDNLRDKWMRLRSLLELGANGSKVIVTTRDQKVAKLMDSYNTYKLEELTEGDSWDLFQHIAFTQIQEPGVEAIGKEIAAMCPHVPLVIRSIAGHLAQKRTIKEWQAFRDDQLANFTSYGRDVTQSLKLSFDQLDDKLKQCVTYCSLFRKGCKIRINQLIQLWMALGYIQPQDDDEGEEYVYSLINRGFFRFGFLSTSFIIMHDLMYDLVVWIGGCKYERANYRTREFDERTRHLSILLDDTNHAQLVEYYVPPSMSNMKSLQSLLLPHLHSGYQSKVMLLPMSLLRKLSRFPHLKVLDLHRTGIKTLPGCVGELTCLRYIDLSMNPIHQLSISLKRLTELLVLNLSYCNELMELPKDIRKLKKLRHLNLFGCESLTRMPIGFGNLTNLQTLHLFVMGDQSLTRMPIGFGNLTNLQTLGLFVLGDQSSVGANGVVGGLAELGHLYNLKGNLEIRVLGRSTMMEARAAKLERKENLEKVKLKFYTGSKDDDIVLENLQPNASLRKLEIYGYAGERLPSWMINQLHVWLPNLTSITLINCNGCKYLCCFGRLPLLKQLVLLHLDNVEYIENIASSNIGGTEITMCESMFPRLENLHIGKMPKLKGWCRSSPTQEQHLVFNNWLPSLSHLFFNFAVEKGDQMIELEVLLRMFQNCSCLKSLEILQGGFLKAIPDAIGNLTSLESIYISVCPELKYLPPQLSKLTNLKRLSIWGCSDEFVYRCSEQGEDWPHIKHISHVDIKLLR